jgi:hypothetical protein
MKFGGKVPPLVVEAITGEGKKKDHGTKNYKIIRLAEIIVSGNGQPDRSMWQVRLVADCRKFGV